MKTTLNFEQKDTKELLAKLDFEFFLKQNLNVEKYNQIDIDKIYYSYAQTMKEIKIRAKSNKKQFNYYLEGQVRKMFTGGFLPAIFQLDESRRNTLFDFQAVGENWAYFNYWQIFQRRKITKEKIWDLTIKIGSILAIILSFIKLYELIKK